MNWMAPEVMDRPYDERSDVWSAGCIVLELASCSFCDTQTMMGKLFEIKHSVQGLEDLLSKVSQVRAPSVFDLLSSWRTLIEFQDILWGLSLRAYFTEILGTAKLSINAFCLNNYCIVIKESSGLHI